MTPAAAEGLPPADWVVERCRGRAGELHRRDLPDPVTRTVSIIDVEVPAVVLGSAQDGDVVDAGRAAAAGVEIARRRGGGGAVWLAPSQQLWVDLVVPRGDPLWDDDVGAAFGWVGRLWAGAIGDLGLGAEVHRGRLVGGPWADAICFAGLGPGEVSIDGAKVVGISQRRVRAGARFQCVCYLHLDPGPLLELLTLDAASRRRAGEHLAATTAGIGDVGATVDLDDVIAAVVRRLPVAT